MISTRISKKNEKKSTFYNNNTNHYSNKTSLDSGFSQGSLVSTHSKATEMPQYVQMREIFNKLF